MPRIYHPKETARIVEEYGLSFKKSLGQNFLIDGNVLSRIAEEAEVGEGDTVLEVGPGIGSLTEEMLLRGASVSSIEIDQRFYPILEETLGEFPKFKLYKGDATDEALFQQAATERMANKFVANLPYVVTSPILTRLFETTAKIDRAVVMVQKEVAKRMVANVGDADYSSLSVFVRYFSDPKEVFTVKPGCFVPRPKVDSSVVALRNIRKKDDAKEFMYLVHKAFGLRRKTLLNSLSMGLSREKSQIEDLLLRAGVQPSQRAEELSCDEFLELYKAYKAMEGEHDV